MRRITFATLCGLFLVSCVTPQIDLADPGEISGNLLVFWVGEDNFVYYPFYKEPLVYKLPAYLRDKLNTNAIRPGAIYTDGGSIPKAVQGWAGLSPWGYGPAYIVHDWLFIAHHCIVTEREDRLDGRDKQELETVRNVDFQISADILAGVIQALANENKVPKRNLAPKAIYGAVGSSVAKRLWDSSDPNRCRPVEQEELARIEAMLRRGIRVAEAPRPEARPPVLVFQQAF